MLDDIGNASDDDNPYALSQLFQLVSRTDGGLGLQKATPLRNKLARSGVLMAVPRFRTDSRPHIKVWLATR